MKAMMLTRTEYRTSLTPGAGSADRAADDLLRDPVDPSTKPVLKAGYNCLFYQLKQHSNVDQGVREI